MIEGSCCCGAVAFTLSERPTMVATCHCTRCRKLRIATFMFVPRETFDLRRGAEAVATFAARPPHTYDRSFCRHCGTALGEIESDANGFLLNANLLDDDAQLTVRFHEFVAEKPGWLMIGEEAPQFAGHPQRSL